MTTTPTPRNPDGTIRQLGDGPAVVQRRGLPRIELYFAEVDGRAECVRVAIGTSFDDPKAPEPVPLTTTAVRDIKLAQVIQEMRRNNKKFIETLLAPGTTLPDGTRVPAYVKRRARHLLPAYEAPRRGKGGRPRYSSKHLDDVAKVYEAARVEGKPPTAAVREWGQVSYSAAAKWVSRAREDGYLPPSNRGKKKGGKRGVR